MSIARRMQQAAAGSAGAGPAPSGWTDPDLANASYDSVSFSVAGQDLTPSGFYIGDGGSKLYVSGNTNDRIYQYTLTTPWDLSSASYDSVSLSVSGQDTQPNGITFKPDGTVMYVSGNVGDDVNQYSLSTAWDLSTASFDSKTLSINAQDPTPRGLAFNSDGSILLVVGGTSDTIYQYDLTTPWDISTGSYASKSFDTTTQETGPYGIYLSPNEDKFWLVGFSADAILQYSVTSADISTTSYDNVSFSVSAQDSSPYTVFFKSDGSKAYILGAINDTIYQYSTAAAAPAEWTDPDLANASYDSVSFSVSGQELAVRGIFFKPDGTKMYVIGESGDDVNEYDLSSAWDVSSASFIQNFSVALQENRPTSVFFKSDGTKMYVLGRTGDDVNEYDLSTAWDISTSSFLQNFSVSTQDGTPWGLFFKPDGTKMYVLGQDGDDVNEYDLSVAWDVSTASFVQNFSVAAQETTPTEINFNPDGTKMFIIGTANDTVHEYDLSTAWDVSTAVYNSISFSVAGQETNPFAFRFKSDGSKMYVLGFGATVYQYSTA